MNTDNYTLNHVLDATPIDGETLDAYLARIRNLDPAFLAAIGRASDRLFCLATAQRLEEAFKALDTIERKEATREQVAQNSGWKVRNLDIYLSAARKVREAQRNQNAVPATVLRWGISRLTAAIEAHERGEDFEAVVEAQRASKRVPQADKAARKAAKDAPPVPVPDTEPAPVPVQTHTFEVAPAPMTVEPVEEPEAEPEVVTEKEDPVLPYRKRLAELRDEVAQLDPPQQVAFWRYAVGVTRRGLQVAKKALAEWENPYHPLPFENE